MPADVTSAQSWFVPLRGMTRREQHPRTRGLGAHVSNLCERSDVSLPGSTRLGGVGSTSRDGDEVSRLRYRLQICLHSRMGGRIRVSGTWINIYEGLLKQPFDQIRCLFLMETPMTINPFATHHGRCRATSQALNRSIQRQSLHRRHLSALDEDSMASAPCGCRHRAEY